MCFMKSTTVVGAFVSNIAYSQYDRKYLLLLLTATDNGTPASCLANVDIWATQRQVAQGSHPT